MPRKTKYRIRRQKNKTKRRINKFFRGKTYKKLYNNRRFTGGMMRAKLAAAAAAAATGVGVADFRGAPVSNAPISYAPNYDAPFTNTPIPQSRSHTRPSPPRSPPSLFYPPLPSPPPRTRSRLPSLMEKHLNLTETQINRDENGNEKITDIIAPDYSQTTSPDLLDKPPTEVVEKAQQNLAPNRSEDLIIFPEKYPSIDGVNWATIMPKLLKFYEYLGETFGKYEVHLIMTTDDPEESDRIVREAHDKIKKDTIDGYYIPSIQKLKECGTAICHIYEAKNGKKRYFVNIDIAYLYEFFFQTTYFNNLSNEDKEQYILYYIEYYMAHEYYHVFQQQHISPLLFSDGFGAEDIWEFWGNNTERTSGEEQPHAISRWWTESFATIMPYFLGRSEPHDKGMLERVKNAIRNITSDTTLTAKEFSDRMMYRFTKDGYLMSDPDRQDWAFLAAAYMAQQISSSRGAWNYLLAGHFYKDFQRIESTTEIKKNGRPIKVPDADKIWLHNFGMTQKDFLHNIFNLVKSGEITVESLMDVLPGGKEWYIRLET